MKFLTRRIRRFRDQEDGLVMTEFLIMLPLLIWTFMALFIYWDAFRTINQAQKGAYSIADLVSRQQEINGTFVSGMQTVMEYLVNDAPNVRMRITSIKYDDISKKYAVLFSRSPGGKLPQLTNATINQTRFTDRIPIMADQDSVVIIETEVGYKPGFKVGIPTRTFDNFIVTRPRLEQRQVCFTGVTCPSIVRL
ncbi:pilus assembly protein [Rhodobacter sp.]